MKIQKCDFFSLFGQFQNFMGLTAAKRLPAVMLEKEQL